METGSLGGSDVHFWWSEATLDGVELLSDAERARAARFRFDRDRASYVAAHVLTRRALSRIASDVPPRDWEFQTDLSGKPFITNPLPRHLGFSLSHTHGLVACGAAWDCDIGVDVERIDRKVDRATMQAVLTPDELRHVDAGTVSFFEYWTRKEAYLKALGTGISGRLKDLSIADIPDGWTIHHEQPAAGFHLSVAFRGR